MRQTKLNVNGLSDYLQSYASYSDYSFYCNGETTESTVEQVIDRITSQALDYEIKELNKLEFNETLAFICNTFDVYVTNEEY